MENLKESMEEYREAIPLTTSGTVHNVSVTDGIKMSDHSVGMVDGFIVL